MFWNLDSNLRNPLFMTFLLIGILGALAFVAARIAPVASDRRRIWRYFYVVLSVCLIMELTGLAKALSAFTKPSQTPVLAVPDSVVPFIPVTPTVLSNVSKSNISLENLLLFSWAIGTGVLLAKILIAHGFLLFLRSQLKELRNQAILGRIRRLAQSIGLKSELGVFESLRLGSPMVFGLIRPTLVLPQKFSSILEADQQDAVLAHELKHIQSNDSFWSVFAEAVTALVWWHPVVWFAENRFSQEMESAADEASLGLNDQGPVWLAEAILKLGKDNLWLSRPPALSSGGMGSPSFLQKRVRNLLALNTTNRFRSISVSGFVAAFTFMAITGIALMVGARPLIAMEDTQMTGLTNCWRQSLAGSMLSLLLGTSPAVPQDEPWPEGNNFVAMKFPDINSEEPPVNRPVPVTQVGKSEEESAKFAEFKKDQKAAFDELLTERTRRTKAYYDRKPFDPEEGLRINKWYNEELKNIISAKQYEKYVEYWGGIRSAQSRVIQPRMAQMQKGDAKQVPSKDGVNRIPDFGSMEDKIIASLGLSETQKADVTRARAELAKDNETYREVVKKGDGVEIAKKAMEINKKARSTMQNIMTRDQYAKYVSLWDESLGIKKSPGGPRIFAPTLPGENNKQK